MKKRKVTKPEISACYEFLNRLASKNAASDNTEGYLSLIKAMSSMMANFNLFYCDDSLEEGLARLAHGLAFPPMNARHERRIAFYDYFAIDNRGLSLIYIRALIELGYEILFITYSRNTDANMRLIAAEIERSKGSSILRIPQMRNRMDCATEILAAISAFTPSMLFVHTNVNDIVAIMVAMRLEGLVERYLINITDHTFWVGKSAFDCFMEFRNYGYNISTTYRGISPEKECILPYYPIIDSAERLNPDSYSMFNGKKLIVSGGTLYKIYGSTKYLDIVRDICLRHDDVVVLYLGNGDDSVIRQYIQENGLGGRLIHQMESRQLPSIMMNARLYLGTYPICGGLMTQTAVACGLPPVGFTDDYIPCNSLEGFFVGENIPKMTYHSKDDLLDEIDRLLCDDGYWRKRKDELKDIIITPEDFRKGLDGAILSRHTGYPGTAMGIDESRFSDIYVEIENGYLQRYNTYIAMSRNFEVMLRHPFRFLEGMRLAVLKH